MTTLEAIRTAGSNSVPGRSMPIARILLLEALLAGAAGAFYVDILWLAGALLALSVALAVFGFKRGDRVGWAEKRALVKRFAAAAKSRPALGTGEARMMALRAHRPGAAADRCRA